MRSYVELAPADAREPWPIACRDETATRQPVKATKKKRQAKRSPRKKQRLQLGPFKPA